MTNIANLLFILNTIATVDPTKTEVLAKEFIVKINDRGPLYTKSLINLMKKYANINNGIANRVRYGDYVVFTKNDVRTTTNDDDALDLDLPIYKLVDSYNKIETLVNNFFKNVYEPKESCDICDFCPFNNKCKKSSGEIIRDGQFVTTKEKVSIFYNFVKVGYDVYEIYNTRCRDFVEIEGDVFEVKSDWRGKYLQLMK